MKMVFDHAKRGLISRRGVNGGKATSYMQQAVCARTRNMFGKETRKNPAAPKTHHDIHGTPTTATTSRLLGTTRVPRWPILARFHKSRVCKNRPRTAHAITENHESYTYTDRKRQTD